jgi:multidrug efflux pump subunit AcrA (membrane-fusion protein)
MYVNCCLKKSSAAHRTAVTGFHDDALHVRMLRASAQRIVPVLLAAALAACGQAGSQPPARCRRPRWRWSRSRQAAARRFKHRPDRRLPEVEVRARVTGILLKRNYREGESVKRGQSLFQIDPAPFQVAYARAEADLATAEARRAQAGRDAERMKAVIDIKAVSRKEYDDAASAAQIAAAEVKSAQARVAERS